MSYALPIGKSPLFTAFFLSRPNRFLVRCEDNRRGVIQAFLPNPGRLSELFFPGVRLYVLDHSEDAGTRATNYTVVAVERDGAPVEVPEGVLVREGSWTTMQRRDLLVPRADLVAMVEALEAEGVRLAGLMAFTAERVRALEPERGIDLDDKSIPHEVPAWIGREERPGAVHLDKGCYRGQETVARVENLGRSPRVLVMLQLDGSAPEAPTPGSDIVGPAGGRALGRLGTVVHDCDFGPVALAVIKRSALEQELQVGDVSVMVDPTSLPEERGEQAGRAAVERLRGRR